MHCIVFTVSLVLMVHTRPIILLLVLMLLIMKVVTSPLVRFQSLFGQKEIPIRVIKYVNEFCMFFVKSKDSSFMVCYKSDSLVCVYLFPWSVAR